jgi:hypothetical protein
MLNATGCSEPLVFFNTFIPTRKLGQLTNSLVFLNTFSQSGQVGRGRQEDRLSKSACGRSLGQRQQADRVGRC